MIDVKLEIKSGRMWQLLKTWYYKHYMIFFNFQTLVPKDIQLSAPTDYTIQIDYEYPLTYYPSGSNPNLPNDKIYVEATCNLDDGTGTTLKGLTIHSFEFLVTSS